MCVNHWIQSKPRIPVGFQLFAYHWKAKIQIFSDLQKSSKLTILTAIRLIF